MLAALAVAELLGMSLWFSGTAVTASLAAAFALSPEQSAWLTMAVQAGFVAGTLVTAVLNLADAVNPRHLMTAGCLLGAAANAAALVLHGPLALLASRAATGAALAWVYPPAVKIAAGWFRVRRGFAVGLLVDALTLGYLGHMWELYAMWAWIGAFAAASLAASGAAAPGARASLVAFIAIASGALGCALAGRVADTWGKARVARC